MSKNQKGSFMWEKEQTGESYSDDQINELSEWLDDLTLKQVFFIKESYEGLLKSQANSCDSAYVH